MTSPSKFETILTSFTLWFRERCKPLKTWWEVHRFWCKDHLNCMYFLIYLRSLLLILKTWNISFESFNFRWKTFNKPSIHLLKSSSMWSFTCSSVVIRLIVHFTSWSIACLCYLLLFVDSFVNQLTADLDVVWARQREIILFAIDLTKHEYKKNRKNHLNRERKRKYL